MTLIFRLLSVWPLWLLHGLGWLLGWLAFLGSSVYRRRFLANAKQAGLPWQTRVAAVSSAGKCVAELPRLWMGRPCPIHWDGLHLIESAHADGTGLVFLTPHMGCFEITAQAYAARFAPHERSITVLFRPARKAWLRALVGQARARPGLCAAETNLGGVKQMMKALKAGQAIGLLPDQVPPAGMGIWLPFFGKDAYTMTLAARLSLQSGVRVLLAWGERLSWGRGYTVHLRALKAPEGVGAETLLLQINLAMEQLVRECPQQYLWGYARYKIPSPNP
jgi:Kdo2-lipid IVA lauroyltransferase/acyltransferase